jgi:16S rRNA (guanine527-N7)-methyltransferase
MLPDLSDAKKGALSLYEDLLRDRAVPSGLVAESDAYRVGERHVRDSLRAAVLVSEADALVVDIGSGAGLPGLVLAIARPAVRFVLVEPKQRAVGFLELVVDRLGLDNVEVQEARVEDVTLQADVATARAYGSLEKSWAAAWRVLRPGGRLIYFAGAGLKDPTASAKGIRQPEKADAVEVQSVVAGSSPLVIMQRQG